MKIENIDKELTKVLMHVVDFEKTINKKITKVHKDYKLSAKNLYRYLLLRSYDLRKYHDSLSDLGVSSLRSGEGYVLSNIYHVVQNLRIELQSLQ